MITYPFTHTFTNNGKSYTLEIDTAKTIIKIGFNVEEGLNEQISQEIFMSINKERKLLLVLNREFVTSTGKINKSERIDVITLNIPAISDENGNIIQEAQPQFDYYDQRYGSSLRCHFANAIAEYLGLPNIFDPMTLELIPAPPIV